jgi:hippurate hydrolase
MSLVEDDDLRDLREWRHTIHSHPETAFEEERTAAFVAERLKSFGVEVHRGLAKTGVVGVLRRGEGLSIGLRADMDALHIHEQTNLAYASRNQGRMHACGHDGHTTMLLGAARALARNPEFSGTVHFIFQPAEENEGGGRRMIEDGLFQRFPMEAVFGLHNWPGLPVGQIGVRAGPVLASFDIFEVTVAGRGAHAAMPDQGVDSVLAATQIVGAWQSIVSRNISPLDAAVISVTQIHAGDTWNVIPAETLLRGTVRAFRPAVQDRVEQRMREMAEHIAQGFGAEIAWRYERRYPATINSEAETELARQAAVAAFGEAAFRADLPPTMGAEDFAFMLQEKPGAYAMIGNGPSEGGRNLHSPHYDFNDEVLPLGVRYWLAVVDRYLGAGKG